MGSKAGDENFVLHWIEVVDLNCCLLEQFIDQIVMDVVDVSIVVFVDTNWDVWWAARAEFEEILNDIRKTVGHVNGFAASEGLPLAIVTILLVAPGELESADA
jgi:hypothetical protein